jgi:hypothetical protein
VDSSRATLVASKCTVCAVQSELSVHHHAQGMPIRRTHYQGRFPTSSEKPARARDVVVSCTNRRRTQDRGTVKKTSEKMDTLSPEWNEAFEFEVVDEVDDMLDISVYGHKKVERNVLLGVLTIPVALVESSPEPITRAFPLHELHDVHKPTQGEVTLTLTWTDSEGVKHVHSGVPRQGEHERVHAAREAETRREFVEHQEEYERDRPEMRERREREEREGRAYEHRWSKRR